MAMSHTQQFHDSFTYRTIARQFLTEFHVLDNLMTLSPQDSFVPIPTQTDLVIVLHSGKLCDNSGFVNNRNLSSGELGP